MEKKNFWTHRLNGIIWITGWTFRITGNVQLQFRHDGLDYAYLAFDVTEEEMPKAFEAIRLFKMRAGNFTMPCKILQQS